MDRETSIDILTPTTSKKRREKLGRCRLRLVTESVRWSLVGDDEIGNMPSKFQSPKTVLREQSGDSNTLLCTSRRRIAGSMNDGWLWDSILNTTARPSPMSTAPAFSPGTLQDARSGRRQLTKDTVSRTCTSSARSRAPSRSPAPRGFGSRPRISRILRNSSGESPCSATTAGDARVSIAPSRSACHLRVASPAGSSVAARRHQRRRQGHPRQGRAALAARWAAASPSRTALHATPMIASAASAAEPVDSRRMDPADCLVAPRRWSSSR